MAYLKLERSDVLELRDWLNELGPLLDELEAEMPTSGPKRRVSVRMLVAGMMITACHGQTVHLRGAVDHLNRLDRWAREQLGLGEYLELTERTINQTWKHLWRLIDPYHPDHDDEATEAMIQAADRLNGSVAAMITASVPHKFRDHPHLAVDTTIVPSWAAPTWSHDRPRKKRNDGVTKHKDAPAWSEPRGTRLTGYDPSDYEDEGARPATLMYERASRTYDCVSACWISNSDPRKVAFGHGLHVAVLMPEVGQDKDEVPLVARAMDLTHATGNPGEAMNRILTSIREDGVQLGDIAADNAFFPTARHFLAVKALGGNPLFHLHKTNQQGQHGADKHAVWIDGRPFCRCIPDRLRNLAFPRLPHQHRERLEHWKLLKEREEFAFRMHDKQPNADGAQRWSSPHGKTGPGCPRCEHTDDRCCKQQTRKFNADDLALVQPEPFGSPEWFDSYGRRSLVEGFFGVIKMVTELRPQNVRFHAHGKLAFAYGIMGAATNLHLVKTWRARRNARKADPNKPTRRERRRKNRAPELSDYEPDKNGKLPDIRPPGDEARDGPDPLGFLYQ